MNRWTSSHLRVWFGPDLQLGKNWAEVPSKVDKMVGAWNLYLNGRAEMCVTYLYPPILYILSVLLIIAKELTKFQRLLSKMPWVR